MINDFNQQIREHFDGLYKPARQEAQRRAALFVKELQIDDLEPDQCAVKLHRELQVLKQEMADFEGREYIHFAAYETVIYKIYSARLIFHGRKEETKLKEAFILSERLNSLEKQYQDILLQLPSFTFVDFLKNKRHIVFYELNQKPYGTPEEDYLKIRNWQTRRKVECVSLETKTFMKNFIRKVGDQLEGTDLLRSEIQQLEYIYKNVTEFTVPQFFTELSKLRGLAADFRPAKEEEFFDAFCRFMNGDGMRSSLSPQFFQSALKDIRSGKISCPPICCWSFIKYDRWLTDILEGKKDLNDTSETSYDYLFDLTFDEGRVKSENIIADFKNKYPSDVIPVAEYQSIIYTELNKLRTQFNELVNPDYYHYLPETETVKNYFVNNCFLNIEIEKHTDELKQVIFLNEMIVFLLQELLRMHENPIDPAFNNLLLDLQITDLITSMVPEPDLIDQILEAFSQTTSQSMNGRKPQLFIINDLKDSLDIIFDQAAYNMQRLFENQPNEKKGQFVTCQIRDLKLKKHNANRNEYTLHRYFADLMELFTIELSCVESLRYYNHIDIVQILQEPESQYEKKLSFGYKKSPGFLNLYIQKLVLEIDFLDNRTTVEDFVRIVTSEDLNPISDKIYLGCQTNQFRYLLKCFKPFFKSFIPSKIERSGLFISVNDNPVTAGSLYAADNEHLKKKHAIDNIFNTKSL